MSLRLLLLSALLAIAAGTVQALSPRVSAGISPLVRSLTGFAPAVALRAPTQSKLALSRVWMCDEGEAAAEEPAAEEKEGSIFDTISALPAELIEKIKGLTLLEAKDLIEDVDNAFGVGSAAGKDDDDASEE